MEHKFVDSEKIWIDLPHYEGRYQVSNYGEIWSIWSNKVMKTNIDKYGYERITLKGHDGRNHWEQVHRLVALAFIPNPEHKPQVHHINEIRNDNRVENLTWATAKENNNAGNRNKNISQSHLARLDKNYAKLETIERR